MKPLPSVAAMKLSKAEYIELCDTLRKRAQEAHVNARKWASRALEAEERLAIYEPGDEPTENPAKGRHHDRQAPVISR